MKTHNLMRRKALGEYYNDIMKTQNSIPGFRWSFSMLP